MIHFENSLWLWVLIALPVLFLLFLLVQRWRGKAIDRLGDSHLISRLMPGFSIKRRWVKFLCYLTSLGLIIFALANPQMGTRLEKVKRQGVDVVIAIDVSRSMLAEDIKPNRLKRSKQFVSKLIESMSNDRVAMIVFAGNAYLQMPLTIDYSAAKLFLNSVNVNTVPTQGTSIGQAINLALESFDAEEKKYKTLIIITDGENHEEGAIEAAQLAKEEGIVIYTLGVGSDDGGTIPVFQRGRKVNTVRNAQGEIVISRLNKDMMSEISDAADGKFFQLTNGRDEIELILNELGTMDKKDFEDRMFTDFEDQFQWPLALALLLLLLGYMINDRKRLDKETSRLDMIKQAT